MHHLKKEQLMNKRVSSQTYSSGKCSQDCWLAGHPCNPTPHPGRHSWVTWVTWEWDAFATKLWWTSNSSSLSLLLESLIILLIFGPCSHQIVNYLRPKIVNNVIIAPRVVFCTLMFKKCWRVSRINMWVPPIYKRTEYSYYYMDLCSPNIIIPLGKG